MSKFIDDLNAIIETDTEMMRVHINPRNELLTEIRRRLGNGECRMLDGNPNGYLKTAVNKMLNEPEAKL